MNLSVVQNRPAYEGEMAIIQQNEHKDLDIKEYAEITVMDTGQDRLIHQRAGKSSYFSLGCGRLVQDPGDDARPGAGRHRHAPVGTRIAESGPA